jgi:hypothetical protein
MGVAALWVIGTTLAPSSDLLIARFREAWARVDTMTYRLHKVERMRDGEVIDEEIAVKLRKPLAVYAAAVKPRPGQEIIYDSSRDRHEFIVHPGHFPDVTLRLDIDGYLATRRQHHLISHLGLDYILRSILRFGARGRVTYTGDSTLLGRPVRWLLFESAKTDKKLVVAKEEETLFAFAERVGMDAYYVFYNNKDIGDITDTLDAKVYAVPPDYGARTELALDAETALPVQLTVWDAKGRMYERIELKEVVINPPLTELDFDPQNPAYDF